jgi:hypothetical protein
VFAIARRYFFCRDLQNHLGVPVGCIATSVPGTNIELWSSRVALAQCPYSKLVKEPAPNWSALWEAMVAPLTRITVRGFVWYQGTDFPTRSSTWKPRLCITLIHCAFVLITGEANVGSRDVYGCRFKAMVQDWRNRFSTDGHTNDSAPFLFVQLAGWHADKPSFGGLPCMIEGGAASGWHPAQSGHGAAASTFGGPVPQQRLVQLQALTLPHVGMACTVDLGDAGGPYWPGSIHPRSKQPVAARLLLEARRIAYGETGLLSRGPQLQHIELLPSDAPGGSYHSKSVQIMRLHWNATGEGLVVAAGGYGNVVFVATLNNSLSVPCTLLPTNLTRTSCDVYLLGPLIVFWSLDCAFTGWP